MQIKKIHFPPHGDDRGQLVAIEELADLPFDIQRVYYIYDTLPGVRRGFHAHRDLQQVLICVSGSCKIHLDNGRETAEVLLVLASRHYDEADYIRDYDAFLEMIREKEEAK